MGYILNRCIPAILMASSAFGADATCTFLAQANAKIYGIPTHMYQTETAVYTGGKARSSELIYLNNTTYILTNGKWIVSPATPKSMAATQKEAQSEQPNMKCSMVRDEVVNGEATTLYSSHDQTPDSKRDSQIWISKSRGVPVKLEIDMDVGGAAGRSHHSIRYEYTNVTAPAGLH